MISCGPTCIAPACELSCPGRRSPVPRLVPCRLCGRLPEMKTVKVVRWRNPRCHVVHLCGTIFIQGNLANNEIVAAQNWNQIMEPS